MKEEEIIKNIENNKRSVFDLVAICSFSLIFIVILFSCSILNKIEFEFKNINNKIDEINKQISVNESNNFVSEKNEIFCNK